MSEVSSRDQIRRRCLDEALACRDVLAPAEPYPRGAARLVRTASFLLRRLTARRPDAPEPPRFPHPERSPLGE